MRLFIKLVQFVNSDTFFFLVWDQCVGYLCYVRRVKKKTGWHRTILSGTIHNCSKVICKKKQKKKNNPALMCNEWDWTGLFGGNETEEATRESLYNSCNVYYSLNHANKTSSSRFCDGFTHDKTSEIFLIQRVIIHPWLQKDITSSTGEKHAGLRMISFLLQCHKWHLALMVTATLSILFMTNSSFIQFVKHFPSTVLNLRPFGCAWEKCCYEWVCVLFASDQ